MIYFFTNFPEIAVRCNILKKQNMINHSVILMRRSRDDVQVSPQAFTGEGIKEADEF